jgi:hypothetical protein
MTGPRLGPPPATTCPGCLGHLPVRRLLCAACELALPAAQRDALARTAGRPLSWRPRAQAVATALGWLRLRREGRGVHVPDFPTRTSTGRTAR